MKRAGFMRAAVLPLVLMALAATLEGGVRRVVILKIDGLPWALVERLVREQNPRSGVSQLPWMQEVFWRHGTRLLNFYVRGISLSAPSWSMLDSGHNQRLHGNAEFDRYTMRIYDYLNFFPFFFDYALGRRVDMPAVDVLDEDGTPLFIDRFPYRDRFQSYQLYLRGNRWSRLGRALPQHFSLRGPRRLLEDSQTGIELGSSVFEQTEKELKEGLADPKVRYLDFFSGEYDHAGHLVNSTEAQRLALHEIDALTGRVWTAIEKSPLASETLLVMVSDHGMNSTPGILSQGFSLVDWFNSADGGGQHVVTDRHPLTEYKIKGLNPFVSEVVTASGASRYLAGQGQDYPTVVLDLDGNERAAIQFRNNDLNQLHMLLKQIVAPETAPDVRRAARRQLFDILDRRRESWSGNAARFEEEIEALHREILRQQQALAQDRRAYSPADKQLGLDQPARRLASHLRAWKQEEKADREYLRSLRALLALSPDDPNLDKVRIASVIPKHSLGEPNTLYDLRNYAVGPTPADRVDYFQALRSITVRNRPQAEVGTEPVDFIAVSLPPGPLAEVLDQAGSPAGRDFEQAVWLYAGEGREAVVLRSAGGDIRYLPAADLRQDSSGRIHLRPGEWRAGLPLELWEDPALAIGPAQRSAWLLDWHSETEWFRAACGTRYSNGIIGIFEQFQEPAARLPLWDASVTGRDRTLLLRLEQRRRMLTQPDMLVFAADHWNFNVRGFNPGGNHGSFLQISTHSVLMMAGGKDTGIPEGATIETPYDSLSLVPTLVRLMELPPGPEDFPYPGPPIHEVLDTAKASAGGAAGRSK